MQNPLNQNYARLKLHTRGGGLLAAMLALALCASAFARQEPPAPVTPEATNDVTNAAAPALPALPAPPEAPDQAEPDQDWRSNRHENHPVIFSDFVVDAGVTNHGDAVVLKGTTKIDGVQTHDSVTICGDAKINGTVKHDLVVVLGSVELGPQAEVDGEIVVVGGHLQRAPGAKIHRTPTVIDPGRIPGLGGVTEWITDGLLLGRPLPFVKWAWVVAGLFLLINLLLLVLFPRPLQACVDTVERQPIGSLFAGILMKLLVGLLTFLLIISMIGIVVVPFLLAALVVAFLFGKVTIYRYVGQQLGRQAHLDFLRAPAFALLLGTAIFYLLYTVPILGFVTWGFTGLFGLGAVAMTIIQKFRDERAKTQPPTPAPYQPAAFAGTASAPADPGSSPTTVAPATALDPTLWPRAGFWIRLCAVGLDFVVFLAPMALLHNPLGHAGPLPFLLLWLAYHVVLWTWKGTTVGGIVTGIKIVRVDGQPLDFAVALIRALASVLSAAVLGLGFLWAGLSREKRSWHDKIAGTILVKVPHGMSLI